MSFPLALENISSTIQLKHACSWFFSSQTDFYTTRPKCRISERKPTGAINTACGIHKITPIAADTTAGNDPGILLRIVFAIPIATNNGPYQDSKTISRLVTEDSESDRIAGGLSPHRGPAQFVDGGCLERPDCVGEFREFLGFDLDSASPRLAKGFGVRDDRVRCVDALACKIITFWLFAQTKPCRPVQYGQVLVE